VSKTMKAAVVRAFGQPLQIEDVAVPVPGAGQILVKIEACGVCHTDLHAAEGDWPVKPNPPFIPGLKVTDTKPGDWVVISGIGGLGHMAVQYAKAMGLNVAAVDIDDGKLALARRLGATLTVNALTTDPAAYIKSLQKKARSRRLCRPTASRISTTYLPACIAAISKAGWCWTSPVSLGEAWC